MFWVSNDDGWMRVSRGKEPVHAFATAALPGRPQELQESLQRAQRPERDVTGHASDLQSALVSANGCPAMPRSGSVLQLNVQNTKRGNAGSSDLVGHPEDMCDDGHGNSKV